jgi:hypothetical protein
MPSNRSGKDRQKHFFAVTSLGKKRWYWVVWPSLALIQAQGVSGHLAEGYEQTKTAAVDQALVRAGLHGEWVAAKFAKQYHRQRRRPDQASDASPAVPTLLEFLYRDRHDPVTEDWYSMPHRVVKKTKKYVYVDRQPYDTERLSGSWLDDDASTFRLSRAMLEQEGYAFTPVNDLDDPLFFTTPYSERLLQATDQAPACFRQLNLSFPCTLAEVKAAYRKLAKQAHPDQGGSHEQFLALQTAYEQALRLCRYSP